MTELTEYQKHFLDRASKGYAVSASRREFKAQQWREIQELIAANLIEQTKPTAWNRAGAFVLKEQPDLSEDALFKLAFLCAEQDRASLADAWPEGSPERIRHEKEAAQLRAYRIKRWGKTSLETADFKTIKINL